jgi:putative transposase
VPSRVSPVERARAEIDQLFADPARDLGEVLEEVARLGARLLLQTALEAEVTAFLGRDRYQRRPDADPGYRNGHQPVTIKTTSGPVTLERPKLRGTSQRFASTLLGAQVTRTNALEALVIAGFVRGLSTRDVEASLAEALGPRAAVSRSTVSRICEQISTEFTAWSTRSLADIELDYLYLDGTCFGYHPGARAEPVLVAYGITTTGGPVFLGLAPAASEGHDPWVDFLADLTNRGLRSPVLVISDGAPGLVSAAEHTFPAALRQRCLVHRVGNVLAKVPVHAQAEVKAAYWQIFDNIELPAGQAAVEEATRRAVALLRPLRADLSSRGGLPDLHPPRAHGASAVPRRALAADPPHQPVRAHLRRDPQADQGHRSAPWRTVLPQAGLGGSRPREQGLARPDLHPNRHAAPPRSPPRPAHPTRRDHHVRRLTWPTGATPIRFSTTSGTRPPPCVVSFLREPLAWSR